jgi:hypothetical protein
MNKQSKKDIGWILWCFYFGGVMTFLLPHTAPVFQILWVWLIAVNVVIATTCFKWEEE